ncbi:hypothetical protein FRC02_001380, partial [Tulasnella sp. 418]
PPSYSEQCTSQMVKFCWCYDFDQHPPISRDRDSSKRGLTTPNIVQNNSGGVEVIRQTFSLGADIPLSSAYVDHPVSPITTPVYTILSSASSPVLHSPSPFLHHPRTTDSTPI